MLPFDRGRFSRGALDATVAYVGVSSAPPEASHTRRDADGSIVLDTALEGRVIEVGPEGLVVEHGGFLARVRHLLPDAIDLGTLLGRHVSIELREHLHGTRCTVEARIRDEQGALLLWARDGHLPDDRASHGLAMRMRVAEDGRGLVIAHRSGLAMVRGPGLALVESDQGALLVVVLRTGDADAAFVALAR
ncbi:MAG: hypothetical protein M3Y87_17245 [Myxococcota bacterium]|nr:hypothetical protein [Myxococcota bacterium]